MIIPNTIKIKFFRNVCDCSLPKDDDDPLQIHANIPDRYTVHKYYNRNDSPVCFLLKDSQGRVFEINNRDMYEILQHHKIEQGKISCPLFWACRNGRLFLTFEGSPELARLEFLMNPEKIDINDLVIGEHYILDKNNLRLCLNDPASSYYRYIYLGRFISSQDGKDYLLWATAYTYMPSDLLNCLARVTMTLPKRTKVFWKTDPAYCDIKPQLNDFLTCPNMFDNYLKDAINNHSEMIHDFLKTIKRI